MRPARSFHDLRVFSAAMAAASEVYKQTRRWPIRERSGLTGQILRSSRAVPALVAEAWARRHYLRAFREKLSQALGEAMETEVWIAQAIDCAYLSEQEGAALIDRYRHIGAMLTVMMQKAETFRPPK